MVDMIKDGKGRGYLAGVNNDNQLMARVTSVPQRLESSVDGNYYEATTGEITITDAVETPMIYIKNESTTHTKMIIIDRVFFDVWESTAGVGGGTLEYYKNPTISGGTDIVPVNSNFGSGNALIGTFKKSMTTQVDGGGTHWWWAYVGVGSTAIEEGRIVLPPGSGFGINYTAPGSNTSQVISINVAMYEFDTVKIS